MSIEYEFAGKPANGDTVEVADGLHWLRMPLPFSLNHINLWLLRDQDGWAIVDTGIGDRTTLDLWPSVFAGAMRGDPATHVIATHLHPDHVGCAGYLARHFDVDFWMSRDEYLLCRILVADTGREAPEEGLSFYKAAGLEDKHLKNYRDAFGFFGRSVTPLPESYKRLSAGEVIGFGASVWEIVVGSGHSPEHACLYDPERNILIAGDQILPTISPNVGVWPTEPLANPLADWFESLRSVKARIPEDVLVLPAHGKPFRGAHERLDALAREHEDRLAALIECCQSPKRVVDTFEHIYKSRIGDGNRIMAVGEALSHLHYLMNTGALICEEKDEVKWYVTA